MKTQICTSALALVLPLLAGLACTVDIGDADPFGAARGTASQQAIENGSCVDVCDGMAAEGCWCDSLCVANGDCCADYEAVCTANDDEDACFSDDMCADGERCEQTETGQCCPVNALCALWMPPCEGQCVPEPDEDTCSSDDQCAGDERCVMETENCCTGDADTPCLMVWPLCEGTCEPLCYPMDCVTPGTLPTDTDGDGCADQCLPDDDACTSDADCPNGYCDPLVVCSDGGCPSFGVCVDPQCDDTDWNAPVCTMVEPQCPTGQTAALINGCWQCVDARTCAPICPDLICLPGTHPVDTDGDGCMNVCEDDVTTCTSDADCGVGTGCQIVDDGQCCMPNEFCAAIYPPCEAQCVPVVPPPLGCTSNSDCESGMFCELDDEASCGGGGTCRPLSEFCYEIYAPVCGCDGQTYDNDCFAHGAGANIQHEGACGDTPPPGTCAGSCGGQSPEGCWCDSFCEQNGDCCADVSDVCPA